MTLALLLLFSTKKSYGSSALWGLKLKKEKKEGVSFSVKWLQSPLGGRVGYM